MKTKTLTLFGLFFLCISFCSWGQVTVKLDSLLKAYQALPKNEEKVKTAHSLYHYHYNGTPKSALRFTKEGLKIAQEINFGYGIAESYYHIGRDFKNKRILDSADYYYHKSLDQFIEIGELVEKGKVNHHLAIIQTYRGNFDKAHEIVNINLEFYTHKVLDSTMLLRFYSMQAGVHINQTNYKAGIISALKSLELADKLNNRVRKGHALKDLADLYHYTGNEEQAIKYEKEALVIYEEMNDKIFIANILNDLGNTHYGQGKYDDALNYFKRSLPISEEIEANSLIAITCSNMGKTLVEFGRIQEAISYFERSLRISQDVTKVPRNQVWALKHLGDAYNKLNQPQNALVFLNKAIKIADSIGIRDDLYGSYLNRSKSYELIGNLNSAFEDFKKFEAVKDTVYNIEKTKEIERLTAVFETEKKEQQLVLQDKEITVLEQEAKISNQQKILLGGGFGLSMLALGFGFYGFRQRTKKNKLEKEKVESELAFKKKELTTHALHLAKKNEVLENVKQKAAALKTSESGRGYQQLIQTINFDQQDDKNWENFIQYFEQVHKDFNRTVRERYPEVTKNELRLMALLKMNLSTKEIANILSISIAGVKKARNRLRKKLEITPEESLEELVITI